MSYVITIAREYASGGRLIAKDLAKRLGVPLLDRSIVEETARQSGFTQDFIEQAAETRTSSLIYNLYLSAGELPLSDKVFLLQSQIIKDTAKRESCIVVGRCADYVLREAPNLLKVFIHAPLNERIRRAQEQYNVEERHIERFIASRDKERASYYNYYSDSKWGQAKNYHISIDSSIGIGLAADIIEKAVGGFLL
ncbi:MAG: cytidylate kinase-like family protein [Oscillospiraceae bacterium]|nr:cytidylate kinase-like family protein [Oscillospiraceae bacterium]